MTFVIYADNVTELRDEIVKLLENEADRNKPRDTMKNTEFRVYKGISESYRGTADYLRDAVIVSKSQDHQDEGSIEFSEPNSSPWDKDLPYLVTKDIGPQLPEKHLGRFATEDDASAFIGTFDDAASGCYSIINLNDQEADEGSSSGPESKRQSTMEELLAKVQEGHGKATPWAAAVTNLLCYMVGYVLAMSERLDQKT